MKLTLYDLLLHLMQNLHIHNASNRRNIFQNWFINECTTKDLAKIPE